MPLTSTILRDEPRETVTLPVAPWARAYGLDRDPGSDTGTIPLLGPGPGFDSRYAMITDLTRPVIIATVHGSAPGERLALLNDGTHRLYKATVQGRTHLPAWVLTQAETLAIRHRPGARPAPAARRLTGAAADRPGGKQVEALCQALARAGHPVTVLRWLSYGHSAALLARLLDHGGPLTHQHLDALPPSKAVHYVRDVPGLRRGPVLLRRAS